MAFATTDDVATRLGRPLTATEQAMAEQTITLVTGLICDAVHRDSDWAEDLDPVPVALQALCVEKVIAIGSNPNGLAAHSETLGAYSESKTFRREDGVGVFLTPTEERLARFAVYGSAAAVGSPHSVVDRMLDLSDNGEIDDSL